MEQVQNISGEAVWAGEPLGRLVGGGEIVEVDGKFLPGLIGTQAAPSAYWAPYGATGWPPQPRQTIDETLADVGDDPALAAGALTAEQATPNPRSTLVERLEKVISASDEE